MQIAPALPTATQAPQTLLAFDFGTRRVGVAIGNTLLRQARLVAEWQPAALVVGVPFHPDGAAHDNTRRARRFARQLQGRFSLPVHEVDERWTTTEALSLGAADADAAAAALILNQYFQQGSLSHDASA